MIKENNNLLVKSLTRSLNDNVEGLMTNIVEVTIDSFLNEGLLKDVPFVSSVVAIYKIGHSVKELSFIKKLSVFIQELNKGIADDEERQKYISQIEENSTRSQREIEYVLLMIDRFIQYEKSQQLARLYLSYLKKTIDWLSLCQYSEVLDRMLPGDDKYLDKNVLKEKNRDDRSECALQRLQGLGIIVHNVINGAYDIRGNVVATRDDGTYRYTAFGETFYQIITDNT